jgi:hypothetical protein
VKSLLVATLIALSSSSVLACKIDINQVTAKVADEVMINFKLSSHQILSEQLIHAKDYFPRVITNSCPDFSLFIHKFYVSKNYRKCAITTKYKLAYYREIFNPFTVLDIDCH